MQNLKILLLLCILAVVVYAETSKEDDDDSDEGGLFGTRRLFRRIGERIREIFGRKPRSNKRSWTPIEYPKFKPSRYSKGSKGESDEDDDDDDDDSKQIFSSYGFGKGSKGSSSYGVGTSIKVSSDESGEKYGGESHQRTRIGSIEIITGKYKAPAPDFELTSNVLDESKIRKRDLGPTITTFPDSFEKAHDFYNRNKRHADLRKTHGTSDYSNEAYNVINRFQNIAASRRFHTENLFDSNDMWEESGRRKRLLEEDNRSDSSAGFINIKKVDLRPYRRHAKGVNDEETVVIIPESEEENNVQELLPQVEYVDEYEVDDTEPIENYEVDDTEPLEREARTVDEDFPTHSNTEQKITYPQGWNVVNLLRELMTN